MKILIIDGQGGNIGKALIERLLKEKLKADIYAVGTNSVATQSMVKAGAKLSATGENPVIVNSEDADIIVGPIGILGANSLLGEITPKMALAISSSKAQKILLPMNRCHIQVIGVKEMTMSESIEETVKQVLIAIK